VLAYAQEMKKRRIVLPRRHSAYHVTAVIHEGGRPLSRFDELERVQLCVTHDETEPNGSAYNVAQI
jgi:hypothetical protein